MHSPCEERKTHRSGLARRGRCSHRCEVAVPQDWVIATCWADWELVVAGQHRFERVLRRESHLSDEAERDRWVGQYLHCVCAGRTAAESDSVAKSLSRWLRPRPRPSRSSVRWPRQSPPSPLPGNPQRSMNRLRRRRLIRARSNLHNSPLKRSSGTTGSGSA